uniref:Uncharacterized protein n=1 Tax=Quercus lobata TaxID=97700 RepID=A0A7N2N872_QUELO
MFQFARLSLACPWIQQQFERLTYSGISGSTLIFNSPKHFVAYYALPRLWVPRYPPFGGFQSTRIENQFKRKASPLSSRSLLVLLRHAEYIQNCTSHSAHSLRTTYLSQPIGIRTANAFTYNSGRFYGRSADPLDARRRRIWVV